jgi:hypothetical protein
VQAYRNRSRPEAAPGEGDRRPNPVWLTCWAVSGVFSTTPIRAPPIAAELLPALVVGGMAPCDLAGPSGQCDRLVRTVGKQHTRQSYGHAR